MVNYQLSKLYKICDNTNEKIYIGSTCANTVAIRLAEHVSKYKLFKEGKYHYLSSFEVLKNENYNIILIENYPCNNKDELRSRERFHIETNSNCVNLYIPIRHKSEIKESKHQIYLKHKEIYKQKYYDSNKEQKQERYDTYKNVEVVCECGCVFNKNTKLNRHKLSKKHINLIAENNNKV
jgi:hypothetical protein